MFEAHQKEVSVAQQPAAQFPTNLDTKMGGVLPKEESIAKQSTAEPTSPWDSKINGAFV
jgi:hypothetical protein